MSEKEPCFTVSELKAASARIIAEQFGTFGAGAGNQPPRSDAIDPAAPRTVNGATRDSESSSFISPRSTALPLKEEQIDFDILLGAAESLEAGSEIYLPKQIRLLVARVQELEAADKWGAASCSFCGWSEVYDSTDMGAQSHASAMLNLHVSRCKEHPLVKRAEAAEAQLALLTASPAPCSLCSFDDGLVQEWLQKVRSIAKLKGWEADLTASPAGLRTWRDMSTAPKDGTRILVCDVGIGITEVARWAWRNGGRWNTTTMSVHPTHWMPLPDPPSPEIGSGSK